MKKKILMSILWCVIFVVCIIVIVVFEKEGWIIGSPVSGIVAGVIFPIFLSSIADISDNTNWKTSERKLRRGNFISKNDQIRISFAYLFRIKVDGKYFLVKSARGTGRFQPVGGVYKLFDKEAKYLKKNYFVEDDNRIPIDKSSKNDYRLRLQDKYLRKFVRRFNKTVERETYKNLVREFREELFGSKILDATMFGELNYSYCGRHLTAVDFSEHFQCYELLLADIIEVNLTMDQEEMFRKLSRNISDDYCFASAEEIKSLGVKCGTNKLNETIATHTKKILQENAKELINVRRESKIGDVKMPV